MASSNLTADVTLGIFVAVIALIILVVTLIVALAIKNRVDRNRKIKTDKEQEYLRKQVDGQNRVRVLYEQLGNFGRGGEGEEIFDNLVNRAVNNDVFEVVKRDLGVVDNQIQNDSQQRVTRFFSDLGEFTTPIVVDRNQKYQEAKRTKADLEGKANKTEQEKEKLEGAEIFIRYHEENLKRFDPASRYSDFFKRLGLDSSNENTRNTKEFALVSYLIYHGSAIYDYFKKYSVDLLPQGSTFNKDGFQRECIDIIWKLCKESLRRMSNLDQNEFNARVNDEIKAFDAAFFELIYLSFQSRLEMIESDIREDIEYNRMMSRPRTADEIIEEDLERDFFKANENELAKKEANIIFTEQNKNFEGKNYFRVVPNPYLPKSGFDQQGNYLNDKRYVTNDTNKKLQQDIMNRDQIVEKSKGNYEKKYRELIALPQDQKNQIIQDRIINPKLNQQFIKTSDGQNLELDLKEVKKEAVNQYTEDLLKVQENRNQARKEELQGIKNIGDLNQRRQAILADRKRNIDFYKNHLYYSRDESGVKLDFSVEYLHELKYIHREDTAFCARIDRVLQNPNSIKQNILNFYKDNHNFNVRNEIEIYKHYLNGEKGKYQDSNLRVAALNEMLGKIDRNENIDQDLNNYNLDIYLDSEIKNEDSLEGSLRIKRENFIVGTPNNEAQSNSFIEEKKKLLTEVRDVKNNPQYQEKIQNLFNRVHGFFVQNNGQNIQQNQANQANQAGQVSRAPQARAQGPRGILKQNNVDGSAWLKEKRGVSFVENPPYKLETLDSSEQSMDRSI
jgi:hypothetical protein